MSQDRWQEVKTKVEGLGLKLKLHLEQEADEGDPESEAAGQAQAAIEEVGAKLQDAVNSLGNAAKDPAIRADLKDLGVLLRDAMNETFSAVGTEVGGIIRKTKGEMAAEQTQDHDAAVGDGDPGGDAGGGGEGDGDPGGDAGDAEAGGGDETV